MEPYSSVMKKKGLNSSMEQRTLKKLKNYLNTIIYSYLETSDGQSYIQCLNVVLSLNTSVN
jgi:hypothetical protein